MADLGTLIHQLDHHFSDPDLLDEALSHRSCGSHNYERLEFLGDSFLNFVIAAELYNRRQDEDEGALSRLRASLVRQSTLAEIARELNLGNFLNLGVGELRSGGFRRDSILSDVVESIIGAVLLDAGHEKARTLILHLYGDRIDNLPPSAELKDPKPGCRSCYRVAQCSARTTKSLKRPASRTTCDLPSHVPCQS